MTISLTNILFVLIIFQLLFLCFFLFTQSKGSGIGNKLLGLFFLAICLNLLDVFILQTGAYFNYPSFAGFGNCLPLVFGPLLYFYTLSIIYKSFNVNLKSIIHFLPFVISFCIAEFYYLSQPHYIQEDILRNLYNHHFPRVVSWVSSLIFLQFLVYAIFSLRLVTIYKKATSQLFSDPKQTDVSWLYSTLAFFIVVMVLATLNGWLAQTAFAKYYLFGFNIIILAVLVFVIQVLMKALRQSYFFSFADGQELPDQLTSRSKTTLNTPGSGEKDALLQIVLEYMQTNRPYLEPELSLEQLAVQISTKPRLLSQTINDLRQQNFFEFINHYRIDEAKRLLTNPKDKKITVLEVLYQVGFNSKSSFNTLFKKYTGLTPTEFRNKQPE